MLVSEVSLKASKLRGLNVAGRGILKLGYGMPGTSTRTKSSGSTLFLCSYCIPQGDSKKQWSQPCFAGSRLVLIDSSSSRQALVSFHFPGEAQSLLATGRVSYALALF